MARIYVFHPADRWDLIKGIKNAGLREEHDYIFDSATPVGYFKEKKEELELAILEDAPFEPRAKLREVAENYR